MRDRWPMLLVAASLLITGGWQAVEAGSDNAPLLLAAGLLLGAGLTLVAQWAAVELRRRIPGEG